MTDIKLRNRGPNDVSPITLLVLFGLVAVGVWYWHSGSGTNTNTAYAPHVGDKAHLKGATTTSTMTIVGVDEASISAWEHSTAAHDKTGAMELANAGRVFGLPAGTEVLLLDRGENPFAWRIRLLDGDHAQQAVWTDEGWLGK